MATNVRFFKIKHFDNYETDFKNKSISDIVGNNNFYEEAFYLNSNDGSLYLGNQKLSNAQEVQQLIENFEQLYDFQREITTTNTDGTVTTETIDYSDIDKGKAIRTIAIEELSYQLLSDKAEADFKTLQELGAWIEDHPESVAEMNFAIQNNANEIDDIQLDIIRLDVQPDWNLENDQSHAYIKNKIPIKKGTGENSLQQTDNLAIGDYSFASGINTISGGKGFKVLSRNGLVEEIEESTMIGEYVLDSIDGLERGDTYSIRLQNNYDYEGTIYKILTDTNAIRVTNYIDEKVDSDREVILWIPEKPTIGTTKLGQGSHTEGYETRALCYGSHAEGCNTEAGGRYSHAEGNSTKAGYAAHAEGTDTIASAPRSHAEGNGTTASGNQSHAEGKDTKASGNQSHAEGHGTKAEGNNSHAEGGNTTASNYASHAEGNETTASGEHSHAEGNYAKAEGYASHAEGNGTQANGNYSHAEGSNSKALNTSSHAEGQMTTASGDASHAEGNYAKAEGYASHAEGANTYAKGQESHAEGRGTQAIGYDSHAEGYDTTAEGFASHTEGRETIAIGYASHAEGRGTVAKVNYCHVQGKYNIYQDNDEKPLNYAHIVGNGSSNTARSNAHTLDWEGNAWYQKSVSIGNVKLEYDSTNERLVVSFS